MPKLTNDEAVQWYAQNRGLYKKLSTKINTILIELLEEASITVHAITNRTKHIDSFKIKIDDSKYDDPINQITDFSGIRIIAYVEDDLIPICKILEDTFHIDPNNSLDKSEELGTDKVGYRSIHYIARIKEDRLGLSEYKKFKGLKFEIQVRTILQHAWAEIEHDKNYKFNGVLPPEIKRRFKILAGTLELADREFNQLSQEIDKISTSVATAKKTNNYKDIYISSTTLKQFLTDLLQNVIPKGIVNPELYKDDIIIKELEDFGIQTLEDLNNIIPTDFIENLQQTFELDSTNFLGILRQLMIITDCEKYFEKSWKKNWEVTDTTALQLYKKYIPNIEETFEKYEIGIF